MTTKQKIIIDCDPGHDDAFAILLAYKSPKIDLLAITTVAGNQTLEKVTLNARRICTVAHIHDVPIAAGCDQALVRKTLVSPEIHGDSGLDGPSFPEPTVPLDPRHAVDLIIELLMNSDGDIVLVPTAPLTNIAMAMRKEPRILKKIKHISLMGGAIGFGNRTPNAEYNILLDPEAARIVFESGVPITMVPLEVTHQALATEAVMKRIGDLGTPLAKICVELLEFFGASNKRVQNWPAAPVHDPVAVAWVIDPTVVPTQFTHVDIETQAEFSYGRTCCDLWNQLGKEPNVHVATQLDFDRFWDLMVDSLSRY